MTTDTTELTAVEAVGIPDIATTVRDAVDRARAESADLGKAGDHSQVFLVPAGYQLHFEDVRAHEDLPRVKAGVFSFVGVRSLAKYVNRYRLSDTLAWVKDLYGAGRKVLTEDTRVLEVVFDDLPADEESGGSNRAHRAVLVLRPTAEARRWGAVLDCQIDQERLIDLVTDGIGEIAEPPAAELQDLARDLHSIRTTAVSQVVRTGGEGKIELSENVELRAGRGRAVTFPETITLMLSPFAASGDGFKLTVRVKAQVRDGRVVFTLSAPELDDRIARLVADLAAEVSDATGLEPMWTP